MSSLTGRRAVSVFTTGVGHPAAGIADRLGHPRLGRPKDPWRTGWARPQDRTLHGLAAPGRSRPDPCGCPELGRIADVVLRVWVRTGMIRGWCCDWSI